MLTVLVRTSYRPAQFARCIESIPEDVNIVVSYDDPHALSYIRNNKRVFARIAIEKSEQPFIYNTYCNELLKPVNSGHCIFLDDDDTMISTPENIEPGKSYLVPFMRGKYETPHLWARKGPVRKGLIGMPCLILWHEHKKLIHFEAIEHADYKAISALQEQIELEWLHTPLVYSEKRNFGKTESEKIF